MMEEVEKKRHLCNQHSQDEIKVTNENSPLLLLSTTKSSSSDQWTQEKLCLIILLALVNVIHTMCYSILSPFFTTEAVKKGTSEIQVGLILGVFELAGMLSSPLFGNYITHIGSRFMFVTGTITLGFSCTIFGFLIYAKDGFIFAILCTIVRIFEGLSSAAISNASFVILAHEFPESISTVVGIMETCFGLGSISGPPLGGLLYTFGGFQLPFLLVGTLCVLVGSFSFFLLPKIEDSPRSSGTYWSLIKVPVAMVPLFTITLASMSLSFLDLALSQHLEKFHLSATMIGMFFVISSAGYTIMAPIWGLLIDKNDCTKSVMVSGCFLSAIAFFCLGPPPPIRNQSRHLEMVAMALMILGVGLGAQIIAPFDDALHLAIQKDYSPTFDTFGLISGLTNTFYSMGSFLGASLGGFAIENLDFYWTCSLLSLLHISMGCVIGIYLLITKDKR